MKKHTTHAIDCDTKQGKPICNCGVDYEKIINMKHTAQVHYHSDNKKQMSWSCEEEHGSVPTTHSEQELEKKLIRILKYGTFYDREEEKLVVNKIINLIQCEQEKLLERVDKEVIGEDERLIYSQNPPNLQYTQNTNIKIRDELRLELRQKLAKLAQKEESK